MESNKRNYFKKRKNSQFKRKGANKKENWNDSIGDGQSLGFPQSAETVYRILCPANKIGGVIGKGGSIVKALREETEAKITVADSIPGSDERVIIVSSAPTKMSRNQESDKNEQELMEPHCAAQYALLKVHDRIITEDLFGGMELDDDDDDEDADVTARLLVPNNMVGCILGKGGDVITRLRSETGANIRVLPAKHLPPLAMDIDELVQISGKPDLVKRALYEASTLLHQNPRKDQPPLNFSMSHGRQGFHPLGPPMTDMLPPGKTLFSHRNSPSHNMPPMQWNGGFKDHPSRAGPRDFGGGPPGQSAEALVEFSLKILCPNAKIGGVIGRGGLNVRQLEQETGSSIHVEAASADSDERLIHVSAFEAPWNPRSQTIDAILRLQNQTSEFSEKGVTTTKLLVPSSKVGCILGQGGHIINEMRRRTQADIRVCSKDDKPKSASEDEELVQISGNLGVAREALAEIASRLRERILRNTNAGDEPAPVRALHGLVPSGNISAKGGPPPSRHGHEYEPQRYPVRPAAPGFPYINSAADARFSNSAPWNGAGGRNNPSISEVASTRVKLQDPQPGISECVVEIRGAPENLNAAHDILQTFMSSAGQDINVQQSFYQNPNSQQNSYENMNAHQSAYQNTNTQQSAYQNTNSQQSAYYYPVNTQPTSYPTNTLQTSYPVDTQQNSYPTNIPPQSSYPVNPQQSSYPLNTQSSYPMTTQQSSYPMTTQQSSYPMTTQQSSYPMTTQQSSYPMTTPQSSYPMTTQQSSYPTSTQQGTYETIDPQQGA